MAESNFQNFNHLKIHSQYSICEGAIKIDALKDFSSVAWLCDARPEDFSKALTSCLAGHGPDQSVRLAMAAQYTYKARTKRMLAALEALQ